MKRSELFELREERKEVYSALHTEQKRADDFFELVYDYHIPNLSGMRKIRTPEMRDKVMAGVQVFMTRWPKSEVDPRRGTEDARNQAAILETFYNYMLWENRPLWRELYLKQLVRGGAIGKIWFDDYYYGTKDEDAKDRALQHFPIQFTSCDFLNCYPSRAMQSPFHPLDMIESYEMSTGEALYLCERNGWPVKWKRKAAKTVTYTAYYDNDTRIIAFDGLIDGNKWDDTIYEGENVLGFTPYVVIPSGLGQDSYEGKPEYKYRDIIYPQIEMVEEASLRKSQINYILSTNAYPQMEIEAADVEAARKHYADYKGSPEEIDIHDANMKRVARQGDGPPPGLFQWLAMLESKTEAPQSLMGINPTGTYSQVHYSTQASYARATYELPLDNLEMGVAKLMGFAARMVEWLGNPISIRNVNPNEKSKNILTVRPDDIKGYHDMRVKFIGDTPESRDLRQQMGRNLVREGVLPLRRVLHDYFDMSWEESEEAEMELVVQEIRKMPVTMLSLALEYTEQRGMERAAELIRQEMMMAGMNLPRGGDNRLPADLASGQDQMPLHGQRGPSQGLA